MSWRDRTSVAARFRAATFNVDTSEFGSGRRTVVHEYAQRDNPFPEDMGKASREFTVEGFVIGDNYMADRDALIAALELGGPGILVHPYFGTVRVSVAGKFRIRESFQEGGLARFSIPFIEAPATAAQPNAVSDGAAVVQSAVGASRSSVGVEFLATYRPGSLLSSVTKALQSAINTINKTVSLVTSETQTVSEVRRQLGLLSGSIDGLIHTPGNLLASLTDVFALVDTDVLSVYNFDPGVRPPATTIARQQEQACFDAMQRLIQRLAVVRAAELAPTATYDSYDAAVAARNAITDLLDEQAETVSDDTYPAFMALRAALVTGVPGLKSDLPKILTYAVNFTVPSLILAFRLYGNLDLEQDLIDRNGVTNPGFVGGGRSLEVLSGG